MTRSFFNHQSSKQQQQKKQSQITTTIPKSSLIIVSKEVGSNLVESVIDMKKLGDPNEYTLSKAHKKNDPNSGNYTKRKKARSDKRKGIHCDEDIIDHSTNHCKKFCNGDLPLVVKSNKDKDLTDQCSSSSYTKMKFPDLSTLPFPIRFRSTSSFDQNTIVHEPSFFNAELDVKMVTLTLNAMTASARLFRNEKTTLSFPTETSYVITSFVDLSSSKQKSRLINNENVVFHKYYQPCKWISVIFAECIFYFISIPSNPMYCFSVGTS